MSGSTTWNYIIAAAVGVVVGVVTWGAGLPAYAALLGTLAFSATSMILNRPQMPGAMNQSQSLGKRSAGTVRDAASAELEMTSSSETVAIPVVFGRVKLSGNYLRYGKETFRAVPIIQRYETQTPTIIATQQAAPSGGKGFGGGGGEQTTSKPTSGAGKTEVIEQIVGYNYYLSFDVGLCMGDVHHIGKIWDSSTQAVIGGNAAFSGNSRVFTLSGAENGGRIRIYRGSATQTRVSGEPYFNTAGNYRHVCWVSFQNFHIGTTPAPRSYQFEVLRLPAVLDATGTAIPGFETRGSNDTGNANYHDANPAAILYEVLTNKVWGRGLSPDVLDIPSFVTASQYFTARGVGLSFSIDSQDVLSSVIDQIRAHVNTALVWTGDRLRCRVLSNTTADPVVATITRDQVSKVSFSRPAWPDVVNELRVEFINRAANYKPELAHLMDDAAIATSGLINSNRMTLAGFSNRATAEREALRILGEISTPKGSINFTMNRWDARLEAGDVFAFAWNEWTEGPVVAYYRVAEIKDSPDDANGIEVNAIEDQYRAAYIGEPEDFGDPTPSFENATSLADDELYLDPDQNAPVEVTGLEPVLAWETPIFISGGGREILITAELPPATIRALSLSWSPQSAPDWKFHGSLVNPWAINLTLTSDIPETGRSLCRQSNEAFTFTLDDPSNEDTILSNANKVLLTADHMQTLPSSGTDLLLVGREIILLGKITETSPGVYTAENYLRAAFGSYRETHLTGAKVAYLAQWRRVYYALPLGTIPTNTPLDLRVQAVTTSGTDETLLEFVGPEADGFIGLGAMPYEASTLSASRVGLDWTVELRPRWHNQGSQIEADLDVDLATLVANIPSGYTYTISPFNASTPTGPAEAIVPAFTPDDGSTSAGGRLAITYTAPAGTNRLEFRTIYAGTPSLAPLSITA